MLTRSLYPLLLVCVLLIVGCGPESSEPASPAERPPAASNRSDAETASPPASTADREGIRVLVLGNSIAAGYGVDEDEAFPARLQQKVDSLGWNIEVVNGGVSGETTAGGLRRLDWLLRQPTDVLVVELGGNDGLRGTALSATRDNLQAIIDTATEQYPDIEILLAGMQLPPNLGPDYTEGFRALYPELAEANDNVSLIPFVLEGVGGVDRLMQSDGIHPTAEGQRIVAQNVWTHLKPVLAALRQEA